MTDYPAGSITRKGVDILLTVDDYGTWKTNVSGETVRGKTRDELEGKINRIAQRTAVRVTVPITRLVYQAGRFVIRRGTAYGIHGGTGKVLVEWSDGVKEQYTGEPNSPVTGELTDEDAVLWAALAKHRQDAVTAYTEFVREHQINLKDEVVTVADQFTRRHVDTADANAPDA